MLDMQWVQNRMNNADSQRPAQTPGPRGKVVDNVPTLSKRSLIFTTLALGAAVGAGIMKSFREAKAKKY